MKVVAVSRQWDGGGWYRIRQPIEEMGRHGHETSCHLAKSTITADGADVIVGQFIGGQSLKMLNAHGVPAPTSNGVAISHTMMVHAWWREQYRKAALVYEIDDDPFEIEPINPCYAIYSCPVARDSIRHCIEVSSLVTASTEPLAERISKINPNVVVLKNHIEESMLKLHRPQRDRLTIGWAGGPTHMFDMETAAYGLRKIMQWHKDVDVHFIGADLRWMIKAPREIRLTDWCQSTTDYYKNIDFDIGIAPLKPSVFANAKSHIKCLEYAALGIPVVATSVDPYERFVIDGVTGFLVRRDHEWAARLRDLINDEAMRKEMGENARELASQWTIEEGYKQWEQAYASVI
jgi:glycosyltransferase involved in cell wall biosynthesis